MPAIFLNPTQANQRLRQLTKADNASGLTRLLTKAEDYFRLDSLPDLQHADEQGNTAYHLAAANGAAKAMAVLLANRPDNIQLASLVNAQGETPLHVAIRAGKHDVVAALLDNEAAKQAWINAQDKAGNTAAHYAVNDFQSQLLQKLVAAGCDLEVSNHKQQTLLHRAAHVNHVKALWFLLKQKVNIDAQDSDGNTALHIAVAQRYYELAKHLLGKSEQQIKNPKAFTGIAKANIWLENQQKETAYVMAAKKGYDELSNLLNDSLLSTSKKSKTITASQEEFTSFKETVFKQLTQAEAYRLKHMNKRKGKRLKLNVFISILCPATVLAIPMGLELIGQFFSVIPFAPFIFAPIALMGAGLLWYSLYKKNAMANGDVAQAIELANNDVVKMDLLNKRLAFLCQQQKQLLQQANAQRLDDDLKIEIHALQLELDNYKNNYPKPVNPIAAMSLKDGDAANWANASDHRIAKGLVIGSFLCAWSGALGIAAGIAALVSVSLLSWLGLAIAVALAASIFAAVVYTTYKPSLRDMGEIRRMHYEANRRNYQSIKQSQKLFDANANFLENDLRPQVGQENNWRKPGVDCDAKKHQQQQICSNELGSGLLNNKKPSKNLKGNAVNFSGSPIKRISNST